MSKLHKKTKKSAKSKKKNNIKHVVIIDKTDIEDHLATIKKKIGKNNVLILEETDSRQKIFQKIANIVKTAEKDNKEIILTYLSHGFEDGKVFLNGKVMRRSLLIEKADHAKKERTNLSMYFITCYAGNKDKFPYKELKNNTNIFYCSDNNSTPIGLAMQFAVDLASIIKKSASKEEVIKKIKQPKYNNGRIIKHENNKQKPHIISKGISKDITEKELSKLDIKYLICLAINQSVRIPTDPSKSRRSQVDFLIKIVQHLIRKRKVQVDKPLSKYGIDFFYEGSLLTEMLGVMSGNNLDVMRQLVKKIEECGVKINGKTIIINDDLGELMISDIIGYDKQDEYDSYYPNDHEISDSDEEDEKDNMDFIKKIHKKELIKSYNLISDFVKQENCKDITKEPTSQELADLIKLVITNKKPDDNVTSLYDSDFVDKIDNLLLQTKECDPDKYEELCQAIGKSVNENVNWKGKLKNLIYKEEQNNKKQKSQQEKQQIDKPKESLLISNAKQINKNFDINFTKEDFYENYDYDSHKREELASRTNYKIKHHIKKNLKNYDIDPDIEHLIECVGYDDLKIKNFVNECIDKNDGDAKKYNQKDKDKITEILSKKIELFEKAQSSSQFK